MAINKKWDPLDLGPDPLDPSMIGLISIDQSTWQGLLTNLNEWARELSHKLLTWMIVGSGAGILIAIKILSEAPDEKIEKVAMQVYFYLVWALATSFIGGVGGLIHTVVQQILYHRKIAKTHLIITYNEQAANALDNALDAYEIIDERNRLYRLLYKNPKIKLIINSAALLLLYTPFVVSLAFFVRALLSPYQLL